MVSRALPPGLESRPLTHADISDAFTLYAAAEAAAIGEVAIELADVESDWARASFDLATESIGVFRGTRPVVVSMHAVPNVPKWAYRRSSSRTGVGEA